MAANAPSPAVATLRRELEFVKSLLKSGRSVDEMVAAANAAARVAARTVEEMKKSIQKKGTELTIRGLPTGGDWDWRAFKRWLQSRGVPEVKYAAKDLDSDVGVVRFFNEAQCSVAEDLLPTCKPPAEGSVIVVERGVPEEYQDRIRKRGRDEDDDGPGGRRKKGAPNAPPAPSGPIPSVSDAVCPLWQVPYGQQLTDKHQRIVEALEAVTMSVDRRTYGASKPDWVRVARARVDSAATAAPTAAPAVEADATAAPPAAAAAPSAATTRPLCCPLLGILRSPVLERYRNKSEFTVGLDEGEKPCVGYLRGAFMHGITCVGDPAPTRHTGLAAVTLAAAATSYLRDVSKFAVYDKRTQEGYWRLLLVREGRRQTFLPLNLTATEAAAAVQPSVISDPTFASLDPLTYLVSFRSQPPAEQAAMEVDGGGEDAAAAASVDVTLVSEAEPPHPPLDEVLVLIQVNPTYPLAVSRPATAALELRALTAALAAAATAAGMPLTTVRVQYHTGVSNAAPYDAPLMDVPAAPSEAALAAEAKASAAGVEAKTEGPEVAAAVTAAGGPGYIYDALCDLRFRISPTAFYQVNSAATCVLYKIVADWAAATPSSLLLDICCGTGTIGITMARRVAKVVGVDSVASAVEDARANAALNGITNAEFVTGKAEDALPGILASHAAGEAYGEGEVVAVADPPRAGLHKSVLRALLGCEKIRRLVFVSCNPDNLVDNVAALCSPPDNRSGRDRGYGGRGGRGGGMGGSYTPFRPVKAVALDLFPHTAHVEAVMLLER